MVTGNTTNSNAAGGDVIRTYNVCAVIAGTGAGQSSCRITRNKSGDLVVTLCHGGICCAVISAADITGCGQGQLLGGNGHRGIRYVQRWQLVVAG